jgi:hypothetical protein
LIKYKFKKRFLKMMWIVTARCDLCQAERILEVDGNIPPYEIGDQIEECPCGGKFVVEKIVEVN